MAAETLSEKWVTARKAHKCCLTGDEIKPGDRYHVQNRIGDDGEFFVFKTSEFGDWILNRYYNYQDHGDEGFSENDASESVDCEFGSMAAAREAWLKSLEVGP